MKIYTVIHLEETNIGQEFFETKSFTDYKKAINCILYFLKQDLEYVFLNENIADIGDMPLEECPALNIPELFQRNFIDNIVSRNDTLCLSSLCIQEHDYCFGDNGYRYKCKVIESELL